MPKMNTKGALRLLCELAPKGTELLIAVRYGDGDDRVVEYLGTGNPKDTDSLLRDAYKLSQDPLCEPEIFDCMKKDDADAHA